MAKEPRCRLAWLSWKFGEGLWQGDDQELADQVLERPENLRAAEQPIAFHRLLSHQNPRSPSGFAPTGVTRRVRPPFEGGFPPSHAHTLNRGGHQIHRFRESDGSMVRRIKSTCHFF
jgi:hypothetical protein